MLMPMKKRLLQGALCFCILASAPRLISLEAHWSSDEALWLRHSEHFMSAVKKGAFSQTLIAYHPGVTTMWLAGLRTFFIQPNVDLQNLARARLLIGIVVWTCIGISILLLYKLFGQWVALASFACLAFSPLFLAQTRRVHTDALTSAFLLMTVLLFLVYCQNPYRHRSLIFSGITYGLALISKSYALILLPWIPLCLFLFRKKQTGNFFTYIVQGICFLNCAVLTLFALWPIFWNPLFAQMGLCLFALTFVLFREMKARRSPMWLVSIAFAGLCLVGVPAIKTVGLVSQSVNWAVTTPHEVEHFFLGKVVNDPGWLFYPFMLSIKSTPLMLPLSIVGCILLWKNRKYSEETARHFKTGVALVIGVALFMICLSVTSKKFSRYLLPAFPMLEILAGIGFVEGLKWSYTVLHSGFGNEALTKYKTGLAVIVCVGFFLIQVMPVLARHPYYGTYYNPCWKVTDITKIITIGDASGLDIAANYLNQKQNASQMFLFVSPLSVQSIFPYFRGGVFPTDTVFGRNLTSAYEVIYIRDSQIGKVPQTGLRNGELEAVVTLNGIDHVWIYRIHNKK